MERNSLPHVPKIMAFFKSGRSFLVALISFSAISPSHAQAPKLIITHLAGDFYVYTTFQNYQGTPFPSNSMYMVTSKGVVLFDTPWDSTQFQPLLDSIQTRHQKKVIMCFATHFHEDRTAGLEYYRKAGIKTYTTRQTDGLSKERNEKRAEFLMDRDSSFVVGQHAFRTFYGGPGHSPDNIVIWFGKERILYGGCLIKSVEAATLGNMSDADVKSWEAAIRKIQKEFPDPQYVIPGHQDWMNNKSEEHTLDLIQQYDRKQ